MVTNLNLSKFDFNLNYFIKFIYCIKKLLKKINNNIFIF